MTQLLELKNISAIRDNKRILQNVNLTISSGKIIGLVGDNGVGKTTLLQVITGLLKPSSGSICRYNTRISYVPNREEFPHWMRVKDALDFYYTYYRNFDGKKAKTLLMENGISLSDKIARLSSGEQERLFLILSISQDAQLYLMDESFSGIDPYFKKDIRKFLLRNIPKHATIILATHLLRELEQLFDEVIFISSAGLQHMVADDIRQNNHQSIEEFYLEGIKHEKRNF